MESPMNHLKMQILIESIWDRASGSAFLTCTLALSIFPVYELPFEKQGNKKIRQQHYCQLHFQRQYPES